MAAFVEQVRAHPGKYTMAVGALGSSPHMAGERMKMMAGLDILNVPYKGTAPAITDLLGGQVDMMVASSLNAQPHIKSGALKALGLTSPQPLPQFPGLPPIGDTIKGFESNAWFALFGPAGMPANVVAALNDAARHAVASPDFRRLLDAEAATAVSSSPRGTGRLRAAGHRALRRDRQVHGRDTGLSAEDRRRHAMTGIGRCRRPSASLARIDGQPVLRHQRFDRLHVHRLAQQKPCSEWQPIRSGTRAVRAFHAFGHDLHLQGVAERDDGRHDGGVLGVLLQVSHEAAIDLHSVAGRRFRYSRLE